ncbi:unnamed protein product [Ectocarpus sp. 8 AP-2014]
MARRKLEQETGGEGQASERELYPVEEAGKRDGGTRGGSRGNDEETPYEADRETELPDEEDRREPGSGYGHHGPEDLPSDRLLTPLTNLHPPHGPQDRGRLLQATLPPLGRRPQGRTHRTPFF